MCKYLQDTIDKAGLTKLVREVLSHTNQSAGLAEPSLSCEAIAVHVNELLATVRPKDPHATEISFTEFMTYARIKKPDIFMALWDANLNHTLPEEDGTYVCDKARGFRVRRMRHSLSRTYVRKRDKTFGALQN
eukprot:6989822-Pyramimonas_sp.AAC.1